MAASTNREVCPFLLLSDALGYEVAVAVTAAAFDQRTQCCSSLCRCRRQRVLSRRCRRLLRALRRRGLLPHRVLIPLSVPVVCVGRLVLFGRVGPRRSRHARTRSPPAGAAAVGSEPDRLGLLAVLASSSSSDGAPHTALHHVGLLLKPDLAAFTKR